MRIVEQKYSLSEEDLEWLRGTHTIEKMLKQRLVVEFDTDPNIEEIDFSGTRGFYLIKSLGYKSKSCILYSPIKLQSSTVTVSGDNPLIQSSSAITYHSTSSI